MDWSPALSPHLDRKWQALVPSLSRALRTRSKSLPQRLVGPLAKWCKQRPGEVAPYLHLIGLLLGTGLPTTLHFKTLKQS